MLFLRIIDVLVCLGSIDGVEPYLDDVERDEGCEYSCCLCCWPLCKLFVDLFSPDAVDDLSIEGKADGWSIPLKMRVFHESRRVL